MNMGSRRTGDWVVAGAGTCWAQARQGQAKDKELSLLKRG